MAHPVVAEAAVAAAEAAAPPSDGAILEAPIKICTYIHINVYI